MWQNLRAQVAVEHLTSVTIAAENRWLLEISSANRVVKSPTHAITVVVNRCAKFNFVPNSLDRKESASALSFLSCHHLVSHV
jgi:hypothetical protein